MNEYRSHTPTIASQRYHARSTVLDGAIEQASSIRTQQHNSFRKNPSFESCVFRPAEPSRRRENIYKPQDHKKEEMFGDSLTDYTKKFGRVNYDPDFKPVYKEVTAWEKKSDDLYGKYSFHCPNKKLVKRLPISSTSLTDNEINPPRLVTNKELKEENLSSHIFDRDFKYYSKENKRSQYGSYLSWMDSRTEDKKKTEVKKDPLSSNIFNTSRIKVRNDRADSCYKENFYKQNPNRLAIDNFIEEENRRLNQESFTACSQEKTARQSIAAWNQVRKTHTPSGSCSKSASRRGNKPIISCKKL